MLPGFFECGHDVPLSFEQCRQNEGYHSNLGGLGPDFGKPEELRYEGVAQHEGASVDLVLTNTSEYCARRPQDNGCKAGTAMAHLNMDTGCDTGFRMQLRDSMTNAVVVVPGFYFSFYDIDGPTPWSYEQIVMEDYAEYVTTSPTNVIVSGGNDANHPTTFGACDTRTTCTAPTGPGQICPSTTPEERALPSACSSSTVPPSEGQLLTEAQAARSVTFYFKDTGSGESWLGLGLVPAPTPRADAPSSHAHVWAICDTVQFRVLTSGGDPRYRNATFNEGYGTRGRYIYFTGTSARAALLTCPCG